MESESSNLNSCFLDNVTFGAGYDSDGKILSMRVGFYFSKPKKVSSTVDLDLIEILSCDSHDDLKRYIKSEIDSELSLDGESLEKMSAWVAEKLPFALRQLVSTLDKDDMVAGLDSQDSQIDIEDLDKWKFEFIKGKNKLNSCVRVTITHIASDLSTDIVLNFKVSNILECTTEKQLFSYARDLITNAVNVDNESLSIMAARLLEGVKDVLVRVDSSIKNNKV